jgi:adenosylmethionine-8-amino-7-oxononanoate aminotransferase
MQQMQEFEQAPLILTHGDGVYVWDSTGRRVLDAVSGVFVVGVGHRNRRVISAITEQLERIAFAAPTLAVNDRVLELAERLTAFTPPEMRVVKFHTGGSEAIEAALKIARQYHRQSGSPHRYKVISRQSSYHGATFGALSATGFAHFRTAFEPLAPGFVHVPTPHHNGCRIDTACPPCSLSCADAIETAIETESAETVAAVLIEPLPNMSGVVPPPSGYLQRVREICDRHGVLLIYDEIVTGLGRLGSWFAAEHYGVWPDLLCLGKGITSGYAPLSAVVMRQSIADAFRGARADRVHLMHGHTYGGNPIASTAALAVLDELVERDLLRNAKVAGERLHRELEELATRYPIIAAVRSVGLLVAVDFDVPIDELRRLDDAFRRQPMLAFGPAPSGTLRFAPPLVIEPAEIDEIVAMVDAALSAFETR